jgi:membrane protein DedA with SNARE-associated domain
MRAKQVQNWVWILIYAGMILFALGMAVRQRDPALGGAIALPGVALVAIGIVLIWIRSRMKDTEEKP